MSEIIYFNPPLVTNPPGAQTVDATHGLPIVNLDASGVPLFSTAAALVDATANPTVGKVGALSLLSNGTSWDMQRNNTQGTLLASAARTAATTSPNQTNYNARGLAVFLNVTVASGTGGLTVQLFHVDPVTGTLAGYAGPTASVVTAIGAFLYVFYPGAETRTTQANRTMASQSTPLPRTFAVQVGVGDASSYTYSLGYSLIV